MSGAAASLLCCCGSPIDCQTAVEFCGFDNYPRMRVSFTYQVDFDSRLLDATGIRPFFHGDLAISGSIYLQRLSTASMIYRVDPSTPLQQRLASIESRGMRSFPGGFSSWDFTGALLMDGIIGCTFTDPWQGGASGSGFGSSCPANPLTPHRNIFSIGLTGAGFPPDSQYALQGITRWQYPGGSIHQCGGGVDGLFFRIGASREHDPACPAPFRCIGLSPAGEPFFGGCAAYPGSIEAKAAGRPYARCEDEEEESHGDPIFVGGLSRIDPELGGQYYPPGESYPTTIDPPTYCMTHHADSLTRELYHFIPPGSQGPIFGGPWIFTNGSKFSAITVQGLTY